MSAVQATDWRTIRVEELEDGRCFRIRLASGKGNVLDSPMIAELREALAVVGREPRACAVLLDHEGDDFSFGASVQEHRPGEVEQMLPGLHALVADQMDLGVPLLVSVRGACLGGGLEIAALAERIFAAPDARFGQPEVVLGVFAPVGSLLLPELVGPRNASDLLLTGRSVAAPEALAMGLVAEVVDDPGQAALAWAREHLCPKSASALRFANRAARLVRNRRLLEHMAELERVYLTELMHTHDAVEGIEAFLHKRAPRWEDR